MEKRDTLKSLLDQRGMTRIRVNATIDGVDVPERYKTDPLLVLHLSYRFDVPVGLDGDAVKIELRFSGSPHNVVVPWKAIWAMGKEFDNTDVLWKEDIPEEARAHYVALEEAEKKQADSAETERAERIKKRSHLSVVPN